VATAPVTMYTTGWCPFCDHARSLLERRGVAWTEIDIEAEPARRAEMIERSGRCSVPQIFIGTRHVGGSDELSALERAGELDALLSARTG
jgi:glutaredoxin 3